MAKVRTIQASFVSGELDPTAIGRVDTDIYQKSADKLRNVYVRPQGGAFRREGLEYVATTTTSQAGRLVPFEFNDVQTYMLVFTPGEMKVYRTDSSTLQATVSSSPIDGLTADIIKEMDWVQSADTLIIVHKDIQPIEITRTGHTTWTAANITLLNIPPFAYGSLTTSTPAGNIDPDGTTGKITVLGTSTAFTTDLAVGQFINMPKGGRLYITAINSNTELEANVVVELVNENVVTSGDWEYESGYEDVISGSRGWARSVCFHKGRLVFGGLSSRPQTVLMSKVDDFFDFDEGSALDDEAINITINDDEVNRINAVFSGRGLQIFTSGGEFTIRSSLNDALTPQTAIQQLAKETPNGSGNPTPSTPKQSPRPKSVDGATVFVNLTGTAVHQFIFNETEQTFNAPRLSELSGHLIVDPVSMDIRRSNSDHPTDYLYVVNSDGTCAVMNSLREQSLLAWSLFETSGSFEDVAVSGNITYFIVKRTINGSTVRHLERLNSDHYMDASTLTDNGSATTSWTGLSHLNGETVKVRGDNFILDDAAVSGGNLTSSDSVTVLEAGLNFAGRAKSLPLELIIQGQAFAGQTKRLVSANIRLYESRNIKVVAGRKTYIPAFRTFGSNILDTPAPNFTGWKKVFIGGVGRDVDVDITQDEPLEFNILSCHYEVQV